MSDTTSAQLQPRQMHRGLVVVGAVLIQLCLGAIYAWSVFTTPLTAAHPAAVATFYSSAKLGLDDARHAEMTKALRGLEDQLKAATKELNAFLKASTDAQQIDLRRQAFAERKKALTAEMDRITEQHGAKEKIQALQYGLSKTQTQAIFSAGLALFAIVMVLAGRMMPKVGPQRLALAGGLVLGVGYVLAGLISPGSFWSTFLFVGLVGGSGIGLGYVVPIAVGMRWFPDKKGLITGLAVAGFGFGALLWVKLAGAWGSLIRDHGLGTTFILYGVTFFVLCTIGAIWMRNPPAGWLPAGYQPPTAAKGGPAPVGTIDFTSGQMLRTPQFYMIFLCFVFGAGAGLMSIGLMNLFPQQALERNGFAPTAAVAIAGTAMAVFFALANGIGRIAWGTLSDRLGRRNSIVIMLATQGLLVIGFQWMAGTPALLYLFAALIGFNFGGNFALFPTITADTFGARHIGQNYGWVFLAYGVGGIFGPLLGGALGDMDKGDGAIFGRAFTIGGVLVLVAAGLIAAVRHPQHVAAAIAEHGETPLEMEAEAEIDGAAPKKPD